ncbi:MAG: hypothetical protein UU47_C0002G0060 [candidate division TM6 bacterium GW2011_GWE2_41_16]|nr:MAG: hypothetical protein UU47_C0002G0060 [candidate division TM6 bacterium GW2011_GWE2_41_16]
MAHLNLRSLCEQLALFTITGVHSSKQDRVLKH